VKHRRDDDELDGDELQYEGPIVGHASLWVISRFNPAVSTCSPAEHAQPADDRPIIRR
jgi:hypothetical protein